MHRTSELFQNKDAKRVSKLASSKQYPRVDFVIKRVAAYLGIFFLALLLINLGQNIPAERTSFLSRKQKSKLSNSGEFDYYTLVLSWSPTYCLSPRGKKNTLQCSRSEKTKYAFVLHGLWPQFENGYPQRCPSSEEEFVPQEIVKEMLDIMPSQKLVHHQYQKHGRCSSLSIKEYFKTSRDLFFSIHIPERYSETTKPQIVTLSELKKDFLNQNPSLNEESLAISCFKGPMPNLKDIRICFSKNLVSRACGANERSETLCPLQEIIIPARR